MNHSTTNQSISIIIPVFNEEKSLHLLYDEIKTAILNYANYESLVSALPSVTVAFRNSSLNSIDTSTFPTLDP